MFHFLLNTEAVTHSDERTDQVESADEFKYVGCALLLLAPPLIKRHVRAFRHEGGPNSRPPPLK